MPRYLAPGSRSRRLILALGIYLVAGLLYGIVAGKERVTEHTAYNHYAHLANAWLHGRQDLVNGAPDYAGNNDFAVFQGKTYISFPPFPALLMLPFVALAGSPEKFQDGQFVIMWLGGIAPALLFLALETLRVSSRSPRSERENLFLSGLFAFGTVFFFTAVEGTVWFAAHVVGTALSAAYLLASLGARSPLLAGMALSAGWMTRPALLLWGPVFVYELLRDEGVLRDDIPLRHAQSPRRWKKALASIPASFWKKLAIFALPLLVSFAIGSWMNSSRYGNPSPFAFGHEHLTVAWKERMAKWGLFHYHFLPKNLGIFLSSLPWPSPKGSHAAAPFQINEHGLALWFTTPLYLWLLWPRRKNLLSCVIAVTALLPCLLDLAYQNSGWRQFGYRFSNDYAVLLFALLAIGGRSFRTPLFVGAAAWSVGWNLFGAITFDRGGSAERFYFREGSQTVVYQPD